MILANGKLVRAFLFRVTKLLFVSVQLWKLESATPVRPSVLLFVRTELLKHCLTECCEI